MKYFTLLTIFFLSFQYAKAQQCETYDRSLFNILPDSFPDRINCIDSLGHKQGAWIHYKVQYNPYDKPDEQREGFYVHNYTYGYYANDKPVGRWKKIYNVHAIYVGSMTDYYYGEDTTIANHLDWMGQTLSSVYTNNDSSKCEIFEPGKNAPIKIECNKADVCYIKYKGEVLNFFVKKDLWAVFDRPYDWYQHKIDLIDASEKRKRDAY